MKNLIKSLEAGRVVEVANYSTMNFLRLKMQSAEKKIYQKRQRDGSYVVSLTSFKNRESTLKQKAMTLLTKALATIQPLNQQGAENKILSAINFLGKKNFSRITKKQTER